jgi:putative DNA methylase
MPEHGRRLIEDYLPIEAISDRAVSEPRTKGHISTMHVWRARRPLTGCRAAIYGALVPLSRFLPKNGPEEKRASLGRANAAKFIDRLCRYPGNPKVIAEAQRHILEAHAERLLRETREQVTAEDIEAGRAPRPRVLDIFAGGGAIPLEAARLGCESHALELNPVAHIIELCTVTYPQHFGASLADDVEQWGTHVLQRTQARVRDVLAHIPVSNQPHPPSQSRINFETSKSSPELSIVAYYWTRTIPCPNPQCRGTVPLYRQTWLRRKPSGYVALKPEPDARQKLVKFRVVRARSEAALGFDPSQGSRNSSTTCPFCQAPVTGPYVREFGNQIGFGQQLMCVIALNPEGTGKLYIADASLAMDEKERQAIAEECSAALERELGNSSLDAAIPPTGNAGLATGNSYLYGIRTFREAFTPRQRYILLTMAQEIRRAYERMVAEGIEAERAKAIATCLGLWLSRLTDRFNTLARWHNARETIESLSSMKRLAMMWDYPEVNIFGGGSGDARNNLEFITAAIRREGQYPNPTVCTRGSATALPYPDASFDAVITDPPYYDNESYSELSDVCYVWLRPTIGFLHPEHFAAQLTPKRQECVAAAYRQGGTKEAARAFYENCLLQSLQEAQRVTKPGGILVIIYAHKTTLGWATLVEALRRAGYEVTEAWPMQMETKARVAHIGDAALRSNIFLVARKRDGALRGLYEEEVRPELEAIVRERVATLWAQGISGADLVIACVGAGLRAFTRFARVEYANGEEVPAERFLTEVETVVLESVLARLSKETGTVGQTSLVGVDPATRFYILWRYTYRTTELEAGEAIIFANGTHVELDGPVGLATGARSLVEKKKSTYRLRNYAERGNDDKLGMPTDDGRAVPVIDALHRTLWLMERRPGELAEFLREARANREQMRLVAQALAGPVLKGGELAEVSPTDEMAALAKLTTNWRSVIEDEAASLTHEERLTGQRPLFE